MDSRDMHPLVKRQRAVTGAHRAVVIEGEHVPETGELDDDTRAFMTSLRDLEPPQRAAALERFMAARQASSDATRAAVVALGNGGLGALTAHLTGLAATEVARINDAGQTRRAQIAADTQIALQEIQARANANRPPANPNQDLVPRDPPPAEEAKAMSTEAKVLIGVGVVGAVGVVGYLLWQAGETKRREEEERRRRDEELRMQMLRAQMGGAR